MINTSNELQQVTDNITKYMLPTLALILFVMGIVTIVYGVWKVLSKKDKKDKMIIITGLYVMFVGIMFYVGNKLFNGNDLFSYPATSMISPLVISIIGILLLTIITKVIRSKKKK